MGPLAIVINNVIQQVTRDYLYIIQSREALLASSGHLWLGTFIHQLSVTVGRRRVELICMRLWLSQSRPSDRHFRHNTGTEHASTHYRKASQRQAIYQEHSPWKWYSSLVTTAVEESRADVLREKKCQKRAILLCSVPNVTSAMWEFC